MQKRKENNLSLSLPRTVLLLLVCWTTTVCSQTNGDVRLAGFGSNRNRGKLEIYYNGQWGRVCTNDSQVNADNFERNSASVVCQQLGLGFPIDFNTNLHNSELRSRYGVGSGSLLLEHHHCDPDSESHLLRCSNGNLGHASCSHDGDIVVECSDVAAVYNGQLRLSEQSSGILELHSTSRWKGVCFDGFTQSHADSACRQLGYTGASEFSEAAASSYNGDYWSTGALSQSYSEQSCFTSALIELPTTVRTSPCTPVHLRCEFRQEQASTRSSGSRELCTLDPRTPRDGDIRFKEPVFQPYSGDVQVYEDGVWGSFCDDPQLFNGNAADVVCRDMGHPGYSLILPTPLLPGPVYSLRCNGLETRVAECERVLLSSCSYSVQIHCSYAGYPFAGLTLREGTGSFGNLLLFNDLSFHYACHDNFEMPEANVVCRQMGYHGAVAIRENYPLPLDRHSDVHPDLFPIDYKCNGNESHLLQCDRVNRSVDPECISNNGISIQCYAAESTSQVLRLVNDISGSPVSGRLEVNFGGSWSSVSAVGFGQLSAHVACTQLGFATSRSIITDSRFGPGLGPVVFSNVQCTGYESSFLDCLYSIEESTDTAVAIECIGADAFSPGSLRLNSGVNESSGALEIREHGVWKRICGQGFTQEMGVAACEALGFIGLETYCTDSCFGTSDGYLFSLNSNCESDNQLLDCGVPTADNCSRATTVGLVCIIPPVIVTTTTSLPTDPSIGDLSTLPPHSIIPGLADLYFYIIIGCVGLLIAMTLLLLVGCCVCCLAKRRKQRTTELWGNGNGALNGGHRHGNMYSNTNPKWPHVEANCKLKMERVGDYDDPNVSIEINGFTQTPSSTTDSSTSLELKDRMTLDFQHEQIGSHVYENLPRRANNTIYVEGSSSPASPPPGYEEIDFLPHNAKI